MKKFLKSKIQHSRPPDSVKLNKLVDEIMDSPRRASRWAALIQGVKLVSDHSERWKLNIEENNMDSGYALLKFIDETAPGIEENLISESARA